MAKLFGCLAILAMLSIVQSANMTLNQHHFVQSQRIFADAFTRAMYKSHPGQNIFYSPYGVFRALTLAYFAAGGHTEHSLQQALHFDWANGNKTAVFDGYLTDAKERAKNGGVNVTLAGRLFTSKKTNVEYEQNERISFIVHWRSN